MQPNKRQRSDKAAAISNLRFLAERARLVVVVSHDGVDAVAFAQIRRALGASATLCVVKNRLAQRALAGTAAAEATVHCRGPTAILFADDPGADLPAFAEAIRGLDRGPDEAWARFDEAARARQLAGLSGNFPRKPKPGAQIRVLGAVWDGVPWSADAIVAEGRLDRTAVLGALLATIAAPGARLVRLLAAVERRDEPGAPSDDTAVNPEA